MTVMTRAEAREEKHYDQVADLIPSWRSRARALMEDYAIPAEFEAHGFEDKHDVAERIEMDVVEILEDAPVPHDAQHFVEDEIVEAEHEVYAMVMEEFDEMAESMGLEL